MALKSEGAERDYSLRPALPKVLLAPGLGHSWLLHQRTYIYDAVKSEKVKWKNMDEHHGGGSKKSHPLLLSIIAQF